MTASIPSDAQVPSAETPPLPSDDCWRRIGVAGDRSCPELAVHVHCRNCPVMAEAARTFFDRVAPDGYLESWTRVLEEPNAPRDAELTSILIFRVGQEWLALRAGALVEVTTERLRHRVPHRTGGVLEGVVNIRGQLQLCVSAHTLLGIPQVSADDKASAHTPAEEADTAAGKRRFLVVERVVDTGPEQWVFAVEEVAGMHRIARTEMRAVPSTVSQSSARFCYALLDWQTSVVGLLDENRMFDALRDQVHAV
ncbi:MAG: chemotaxis protein [Planctomycetota bacterium]|nr:MAG: chemotaxis protein [Planctomycetota bacterium]